MREELDHFLTKRYPKIFKNRTASIQESCMAWGFSCGDGWFNILNTACGLIDSHIKHVEQKNRDNAEYVKKIENYEEVYDWVKREYEQGKLDQKPVPVFIAQQVKEKFGTLRFYYSGGDDYIDGVVRFAESISGKVCEVCGDTGHLSGRGYISTKCVKHKGEYDKDEPFELSVDDDIVVLKEGEYIDFKIAEVINGKEVKGYCYNEKWEVEETLLSAKMVETDIFSYWELV
jgi:hypothetical protein